MSEGPANVSRRNIDFVSHSDQGGRGDGVQIIVLNGYAYIGHLFSNGVSILDVRDPKHPKAVNFLPAPPNTWNVHVHAADNLLLVINGINVFGDSAFTTEAEYYTKSVAESMGGRERDFTGGLSLYDISEPDRPRQVGFLPVDGLGIHRIWYVGGRYAYMSAHFQGYSDFIFLIVDVSDPAHPREVGRWWLPGMWQAGGEAPSWRKGQRFALHHAIVANDIAYGSWRDGGLTLLDVADPTQPKLLAHRNWCPPFGGGTHTAVPLAERNLVIVADEAIADNCADQIKYTWVVDVREPTNPINIATFPNPAEEDYCAKGGHFGPHNLHENRPGSFQSSELIFATYQNAGVRVFDIRNPFRPEAVAHYVPPPPERIFDPRPGSAGVIQSCDVFVDRQGLLYVTDYNAGLYILEYKGG